MLECIALHLWGLKTDLSVIVLHPAQRARTDVTSHPEPAAVMVKRKNRKDHFRGLSRPNISADGTSWR